MLVNFHFIQLREFMKFINQEYLQKLLGKQEELKQSQTLLLQIQLELKQKFMATEIKKISKIHKPMSVEKTLLTYSNEILRSHKNERKL